MVTYEFRYFNALSAIPVVERSMFRVDGEARIRGMSELLRLPHNAAVEVRRGAVLIYAHRRRIAYVNPVGRSPVIGDEAESGAAAPGDGHFDDGPSST